MADWTTISALATAGGTLVLAAATFSSVRSANRAARVAERALQAGLRPLLLPSRPTDPPEKVNWLDQHWAHVPGGQANVETEGDVIYLAMSVRNAGAGIAVLHAWYVSQERVEANQDHAPPEDFRRLTRDLYIPAGDSGFWQSAIRDRGDPLFDGLVADIVERSGFTLDLLYGDNEGGQRTISRFSVLPRTDRGWLVSVVRHWNLDRTDPR